MSEKLESFEAGYNNGTFTFIYNSRIDKLSWHQNDLSSPSEEPTQCMIDSAMSAMVKYLKGEKIEIEIPLIKKSQLTEAIHALNSFNRAQQFMTSKEELEKYFVEKLGL